MKVLIMNCSPVRNGATAEIANIVISVSPSYWADVPGQFKSFIDRCTPWCNTHEPHAKISSGRFHLKMGFAEVNRIICFTKRLTDLEE